MGAGVTRPAYGGTRLSPRPEPLAATCEARRLAGVGGFLGPPCPEPLNVPIDPSAGFILGAATPPSHHPAQMPTHTLVMRAES